MNIFYILSIAVITVSILLLTESISSYSQLSDKTGLQQRFTIETDGYAFEILTVSNFDIENVIFDKDEKKLTLYLNTGIEDNLSEIQIPRNLINGNFTFFLNDTEVFFKINNNEEITFITAKFSGKGAYKLDIIGTTYLPEFSVFASVILAASIFGVLLLSIKGKSMSIITTR